MKAGGVVAWAPLAPSEVYYPPVIHIGYRRRSWWNCFFHWTGRFLLPTHRNICVARPWRTVYINKVTYIKKVKYVTHKDVKIIDRRDDRDKSDNRDKRDNRGQKDNRTVNSRPDGKRNAHPVNHRFVPLNARVAAGATAADAGSFGERGKYRPVSQTSPIFTRGQSSLHRLPVKRLLPARHPQSQYRWRLPQSETSAATRNRLKPFWNVRFFAHRIARLHARMRRLRPQISSPLHLSRSALTPADPPIPAHPRNG
jgi:hypothetical protein